jgi:bifunctional non-homologous end joining protein LigD
LQVPDRITIDLDPDPELPWRQVVEGATLTRALIEGLKLRCFLKTTGGKGLHVVFPIKRRHTWGEVKAFAESIAKFLVRAEPARFTAKIAKRSRGGKIFWDELDSTDIRGAFSVRNIPLRLRSLKVDPWAGYDSVRQSITDAMRKALAT